MCLENKLIYLPKGAFSNYRDYHTADYFLRN